MLGGGEYLWGECSDGGEDCGDEGESSFANHFELKCRKCIDCIEVGEISTNEKTGCEL